MKRLLMLCTVALAFVACGKEEEKGTWLIDWAPIEMFIYVQDANGQDLLNPQSESAINLDNITINYEGESFSVKKGYSRPNEMGTTTRTYAAFFDGITLEVNRDGVYYLSIGEWNGDDKREYTEVTLDWGDGTSEILGFSNDYTYDERYRDSPEHTWGYTFYRSGFLNGKAVDVDNDHELKFTIIR